MTNPISELPTKIDRTSKLIFKEFPQVLFHLAFPGETIRVVNVEENVEINLPTRPVDLVMTIATENGEKKGLHVEFYSGHKDEIPQTLFIYSGELTDRMNMEVATIVIYSERRLPKSRPKPEYAVTIGEQVINYFSYQDIWLMDYEEEIRSGELAPLAPFLLEIVTKPTEETVLMAKELALTEPNEERRGLLLSLVSLLAGRYFDKEQLKKWFLKEAKMIRTNTFIDDWLEEAKEKGEQEGEQRGYKKGEKITQRRLLLRLLERRFGGVPVDLVLRTEKLLTAQLNRLFDLAVDAKSLDEIEQAMTLPAL